MSQQQRHALWHRSCSAFLGQLVRVRYREGLGGRPPEIVLDAELKRVDAASIAVKPVTEKFPDHLILIDFDQLRSIEAL